LRSDAKIKNIKFISWDEQRFSMAKTLPPDAAPGASLSSPAQQEREAWK